MLFFKFIFFSFLGYLLECIYTSIKEKRITLDRGFLIGPYCPIYGITLLLIEKINNINSFFLFLMCILIIGIIEYLTSYILEKIFNRRWWDYSKKRINIKGRICLGNLIFFSIGTLIIVKKIIPFINTHFITKEVTIIFIFFLFIILSIDIFISIKNHLINRPNS